MTEPPQENSPRLDSALAALEAGFLVGGGRFTLMRLLGRGGMGVVWLARDESLHEEVALKFLPSEIRHDRVALDDLRRETARSRKLTHSNIIRIHDLYKSEEEAFISMEYVDGPDLSDLRLEQPNRVLGWSYLEPLVQQLCEALDYAHGERIVHRDLKPANMMLDSRGRLKLADFGIAAVVCDSVSRITMRHAQSGTSTYMSPQQMDGRLPQVTDDVYAFGATLYELMTSRPPFFSGDIPHQVRNLSPQPISDRLAELDIDNPVPPAVAALIMACLAKDPLQRPQTMRAVAEWIGVKPSTRVHAPEPLPTAFHEPAAKETSKEDDAVEPRTPGFRRTLIISMLGLAVAAVAVWGLSTWKRSTRVKNSPAAGSQAANAARSPLGQGELMGAGGPITDIQFSFDQNYVLTASRDGALRCYSGSTRDLKWTVQLHPDGVVAIGMRREGRMVAAAAGRKVTFHQLDSGQPLPLHVLHAAPVNDVAFSSASPLLATVDAGGHVILTDFVKNSTVREWIVSTAGIRCAAFSPDDAILATGGDDNLIRLWDTKSGSMVRALSGHKGIVWALAFSPDGSLLASSSRDRSVRLWDTESWKERRKAQWNSDANLMTAITFHNDFRLLLAAAPTSVMIYDINTMGRGRERRVESNVGRIRAIAISPDGTTLASGGDDFIARLAAWE